MKKQLLAIACLSALSLSYAHANIIESSSPTPPYTINGAWLDTTQNGVGFNFIVQGTESSDGHTYVYYYGYDHEKKPLWLLSRTPIHPLIAEQAQTIIMDRYNAQGNPGEEWGKLSMTPKALGSNQILAVLSDKDGKQTLKFNLSPLTGGMQVVSHWPAYFAKIRPIVVKDHLSSALGASNSYYSFTFEEAAKIAGHVCPAIAGAWMMTDTGLKNLFGDETPVRGRVKVRLGGKQEVSYIGAIANVISMITGATKNQGFKGILGTKEFNRQGLFEFDAENEGPLYAEFTRLDAEQNPLKCVRITYNMGAVPSNPEVKELMGKINQGQATVEEEKRFGQLWGERVEKMIIDNYTVNLNPEMIKTEECASKNDQ